MHSCASLHRHRQLIVPWTCCIAHHPEMKRAISDGNSILPVSMYKSKVYTRTDMSAQGQSEQHCLCSHYTTVSIQSYLYLYAVTWVAGPKWHEFIYWELKRPIQSSLCHFYPSVQSCKINSVRLIPNEKCPDCISTVFFFQSGPSCYLSDEDKGIAQCGYTWACWFMALASFCLDFQPMLAQSDWLIGQLTARGTPCSPNSITELMGLKLKDTLDIQGSEVGKRDVWFGRALLPYAIGGATRRDVLLPGASGETFSISSKCTP